MTAVRVRIEGLPAPQGSKSAKGRRANGSVILVESSKKLKPWRALVKAAAASAVGWVPGDVPAIARGRAVRMEGWVVMPRPASVPMRHRRYPVTTPDLDKILRSIGDGLTGIVYHDDNQVVGYGVDARYHDDPDVAHLGLEQGASIVLRTLDGR